MPETIYGRRTRPISEASNLGRHTYLLVLVKGRTVGPSTQHQPDRPQSRLQLCSNHPHLPARLVLYLGLNIATDTRRSTSLRSTHTHTYIKASLPECQDTISIPSHDPASALCTTKIEVDNARMASLIPLIQDLWPMIMPSSVHIARDSDIVAIPARAEMPPWRARQRTKKMKKPPETPAADQVEPQSDSGSESEDPAEPIQLLDCDEEVSEAPPKLSQAEAHQADGDHNGRHQMAEEPETEPNSGLNEIRRPNSSRRAARPTPQIFRKDAMVGITDKMCASGKLRPTPYSLLPLPAITFALSVPYSDPVAFASWQPSGSHSASGPI